MSYLTEISSASLSAFLSDLKNSSDRPALLSALVRAHPSLLKSLRERIFLARDRDLNGVAAALDLARQLVTFDASQASEVQRTWLTATGGFDFVPGVVYAVVAGKMDVNVARLFGFMNKLAENPEIASYFFRSINWSLDTLLSVPGRRLARPEFLKFSVTLLKQLPEISEFIKTLLPTVLRLVGEIEDVSDFRTTLETRVVGSPGISRQVKQRLFDGGVMAAMARRPELAKTVRWIIAHDLLKNGNAASEILKVAKFPTFSLAPIIVKKFPTLLETAVVALPAPGLNLKYLSIGNFLTMLFRAAGRVAGISKADLTKAVGGSACPLVKVTGLRLLLATLEAENVQVAWLPDLSFLFAQHGVTEEISDSHIVALALWAQCVATYRHRAPGNFRLFRVDWTRKIREISDRTCSLVAKLILAKLLAEVSRGARLTPSVADGVVWLFRLRRDFRKANLEAAETQLTAALHDLLAALPFGGTTLAHILVAKVKREEQISDLHAALTKIASDPLALITSPADVGNIFALAVAGTSLAKYFTVARAEAEEVVKETGNSASEISGSNFRSPVPLSLEAERRLLREVADLRAFVEAHLGSLIFSLGSADAEIRRQGGETLGWLLARLRTEMETEEKRFAFKELPQVFWVLLMLRNSLPAPAEPETAVARQPLVRLSFAAATVAVLLRPEHAAYKAVYKNVTTGERFSTAEIPLFAECMQSESVEEAKTLRVWWLRFVARASECDLSAKLLHRHRLMEISMSLAVANSTDRVAASLAISIVVGLVRGASVEQREKLIRKFGIPEWLAHVAKSKHVAAHAE